MVIIDGDEQGLYAALYAVARNPNPRHVDENLAAFGYHRPMDEVIGESLAHSCVASYAHDGDDAAVCGISAGFRDHVVWMLASAGTVKRPRWLLRAMRRCLRGGERFLGKEHTLTQVIPVDYPEGIAFAGRFGFKVVGIREEAIAGGVFAEVRKDL